MNNITVELKSGTVISAGVQSGKQFAVDLKNGVVVNTLIQARPQMNVEITGRGPQGEAGPPCSDGTALTNLEIEALLSR